MPVLAGAAAVIAASVLFLGSLGGGQESDPTAQGVAYLESLEQKDPNAVNEVLRQRRIEELEQEREELLRQVRAGERDPFTLFQDAVLLGDSRAVGFSYYGFLDESRTMTGTGDTILSLPGQIDEIVAMNPRYVYLCYGLNDIKIGYWGSHESHITQYLGYVDTIRQRLPDVVVIISSVLPYVDQSEASEDPAEVSASASGSSLTAEDIRRLETIPAWNEAMKKACEEFGVIFVDNSQICTEYEELWEPDGIHVKKSFYPYWGKNLVEAALEEGGVVVEDDAA